MAGSLGSLVIELAANTARLQSDMGKAVGIAERAAGKLKSAFKFAGGGLIGTFLISTAKQAIEFGDNINKAAIKAGIGGKAMSELAYAARLADIDITALSTGIKKMQVSLSEAGTGAKGPTQALAALGLTADQVLKRKPAAQFELLADRISKLADPADRARAAVELFGKAGADLLPLFAKGAAGIAQARAEAQKLGISLGDDQIEALAGADDSIKHLDAAWDGFAATLTAKVAPALSAVLDQLSGLDTRAAAAQVPSLEKTLKNMEGLIGPEFEEQRKELRARLARARLQLASEQANSLQTGTSGGPQGRTNSGYAMGYSAADAKAAAEAAAIKAREAQEKEEAKWAANHLDLVHDLNTTVDGMANDALQQDMKRIDQRLDASEEYTERVKQQEKDLAAYRDQQAQANALFVKDIFSMAFDDMIQNGKIAWDRLLKYFAARLVQSGLDKAFSSLINGSSSGGGLWSSIFGGLAGAFTGGGGGTYSPDGTFFPGRASGGSVLAGQSYVVGEKGREVLTMGSNGFITPNNKLGGGSITYAPRIDARGATVELAARLPGILREAFRQFKDDLDRGRRLVPA